MISRRLPEDSVLTGVVLLGLIMWTLTRIWRLESSAQAITVGASCVVLTACFELLFGHYVASHSWQRLLRDNNLLAGRVWLLLPLWVAAAP